MKKKTQQNVTSDQVSVRVCELCVVCLSARLPISAASWIKKVWGGTRCCNFLAALSTEKIMGSKDFNFAS